MRVARLAAEQHGRVSVGQLASCGLDADAVMRRVRGGRLHRVHRGVYAVGHAAPTMQAAFMSAVLACGETAVLSHCSAAALWGMLRWDEDRLPEVTVVGPGTRVLPGLRVHRTGALERRDVMRAQAIRVTSPARTLIDVAPELSYAALRRAVRQAQAERRVNVRQILDVLARARGRRGRRALAAIVAPGPAPTASALEDAVLDLIDGARLPCPELNPALIIDGRRVIPDMLWRDERVVVEVDSVQWHDDRLAREDDAERQALLEAHGHRVLRVTHRQAVRHAEQTLTRIRSALTPSHARAAGAGARRGAAAPAGLEAGSQPTSLSAP